MGNRTANAFTAAVMALCLSISGTALAHSGRTDANGGHRDKKNVSGLGSYHYHHGYGAHLHPGGVCPYGGGGSKSSGTSSSTKASSKPKTVHASSVQVSGAPETVYVDQPFRLEASVGPSGAQEQEITWSSSDESIAAVSALGEVTPKRAGTVQISAKTSNGIQKTLTLKIAAIEVTSVTLSAEVEGVMQGEKTQLHAAVLPENATNPNVTWTSSDESILQVDETGMVTGIAVGTATITATASNGKAGTLEFTCLPIPVTSVEIEFDESALEGGKLKLEKEIQLQAVVRPANATDPTVTWSVSDEEIAQITEEGMLTAKKGGKVTVTATCKGDVKDSIEIETQESSTGAAVAGVVGIGVIGAGGWMLYKKKKGEA